MEDEGETSVKERLKSGRLPVEEALAIAAEVAEGLERIHAARLHQLLFFLYAPSGRPFD